MYYRMRVIRGEFSPLHLPILINGVFTISMTHAWIAHRTLRRILDAVFSLHIPMLLRMFPSPCIHPCRML